MIPSRAVNYYLNDAVTYVNLSRRAQNFTEVGQSTAELWPEKLSTWRPFAMLNSKNFHVVKGLQSSGSKSAVVYTSHHHIAHCSL